MNAVAQHWFIELSAGSSEAREQKRTLLAMPVRVLPIDNMRIQSNASINFKQYSSQRSNYAVAPYGTRRSGC